MKVNFMTFNIRHDPGGEVGKFDALPSSFLGEQPWSLRKYKVADTVLMWSPDIVGFQVNGLLYEIFSTRLNSTEP